MLQTIKNVWWQLKSYTVGRYWTTIQVNLDEDVITMLSERFIRTGESVEQIIQDIMLKATRGTK